MPRPISKDRRLLLAALLAAAASWGNAPAAADADGSEGGDPAPAAAPPEETPAGPAPADAPETEHYVALTKGDDVRVRAGPSVNYRVLERLKKGSWVVVTGMDGEFARVSIPGGVPLYIHKDLVRMEEEGGGAVVSRSDVLLRPTPGQEYFPLEGQKLQEGERLVVLGRETGESAEWVRVLPPARIRYFVHAPLLERLAPAGEKTADLARIELERRDGYTGGSEAAAARAAEDALEAAFTRLVDDAAAALKAAPEDAMPPDTGEHRERLRQVMTESGRPESRGRAGRLSQDFLLRERSLELARVKAEKIAVKEELERRLAEVEARHALAMEELRRAAPAKSRPTWLAVGTLKREKDGYVLVKGGIVLHHVDSLKYDLSEMVGLRVGVDGKKVEVGRGVTLLRVDALEILE